jgi:hypothetical protein
MHERENFYGEKGEPLWTRMPSAEELQSRIESMRRYRVSIKKAASSGQNSPDSDDSELSILAE